MLMSSPPPEVGTSVHLYRWNLFTDSNPRYETSVVSVTPDKNGNVIVLKDIIQAPFVVIANDEEKRDEKGFIFVEKRDEKAVFTCVAFSASNSFLFYSPNVSVSDKKITIGKTYPKDTPDVKKDQNIKIYLLNNFMNYSAAWTTVVGGSTLVLNYSSPITLPNFSANLISTDLVKTIHESGRTMSDPRGALLADDDFDFPVVTSTQQWKIESNGQFWTRGSTHGELRLGSESVVLTVEQGLVNNTFIFSDGKGSYVRAVKTLPYILLGFGATKAQATSFTLTWISPDQMILSSTGSQSSKKCHKSSSRTWVAHDKFVYLTKKQPSDSAQDKEAVLTVHRQ